MMTNQKQVELLLHIKAEFPGSPPPTVPSAWLPESEALEDTAAFWGKQWSELTVDDFHNNMYVFFKLPIKDIPYFLGAYMYASLKEEVYFSDAFILILDDPLAGEKASSRPSFFASVLIPALTNTQREILGRYMAFAYECVDDEWKGAFKSTIIRARLK